MSQIWKDKEYKMDDRRYGDESSFDFFCGFRACYYMICNHIAGNVRSFSKILDIIYNHTTFDAVQKDHFESLVLRNNRDINGYVDNARDVLLNLQDILRIKHGDNFRAPIYERPYLKINNKK